jgi:Leucine-rich repeat (LRR) protein
MVEKELMQTITVDGEAQEAWLSEVRRFHSKVNLLVVDLVGQQHTLVEINRETASWHFFEGPALRFKLIVGSRQTSWSGHYGSAELPHIRVDKSGQPEVWFGNRAVVKFFSAEASPEDWLPGIIHVEASCVLDLAALLASDRTTGLQSLDMGKAKSLTDLQPIGSLIGLKSLNLSNCKRITDLSPLTSLPHLTSLNLSGCEELSDLGPLASLNQLTSLNLSGCGEIRNLGPLASLAQLTSLGLSLCKELRNLHPLANLVHLTVLNFSHCGALNDLGPLAGLNQLTLLNLSDCGELRDIGPLANLTRLTSLDLSRCWELRDLDSLAGLIHLQTLNLVWCKKICDLGPLENLTELRSLDLSHCGEFGDIGPLAGLTKLTTLDISDCWKLSDLSPLGLTRLTSLVLSHCEILSDLSPLTGLTELKSLNCADCEAIRDLSPLAGLTQITSLNFVRCSELSDLGPLAGLTQLTKLNVSSCMRLSRIAPIAVLPSLAHLELCFCANIRDAGTLCDSVALCDFEYDETATRDIVLLACAVRRGDADLTDRTATAASSFELSKTPDLHALHLVSAIEALSLRVEDHSEVFRAVADAFRTRGEVPLKTWETLLTAIVRAPDPGLRPAFEIALEDLPSSEIERILGPALIALADAPASARGWALDLAQRALVPVAASASHAREVAPAAAVFFHAQGRTADFDAWMERGSVVQVPAWRDRVLLALFSRALCMDEVLEARRLLGLERLTKPNTRRVRSERC